ncbi:MAG TPA: pyruvate, water dikinase regulatory protein [Terriglobales bacterium]|nr:pyruvate, water dikinase regulatory protein [Terriglobales bacterium]
MPKNSKAKYIWIISDGSGATAERVLQASLVQFKDKDIIIDSFPDVLKKEQIREILKKASRLKALIAYTLVTPELRNEIIMQANQYNLQTVDLLGPLLTSLSNFLSSRPEARPGLLSQMDHSYFKRIDAVGFAVKHDDGHRVRDLNQADLVIAGVSRTSKTPLSIYLAYNKGLLVANVPLILGMTPPEELFQIDQSKVVGLTLNPELLIKLRQSRLAHLSHPDINYADPKYVVNELNYSHRIFQQNPKWSIINITGKAIEEIANEVCSLTQVDSR